jgi:hypothetical protein
MRTRDVIGVALVSVPLSFVTYSRIVFSDILFVNVDRLLYNFNRAEGDALKCAASIPARVEKLLELEQGFLCDFAYLIDLDINLLYKNCINISDSKLLLHYRQIIPPPSITLHIRYYQTKNISNKNFRS